MVVLVALAFKAYVQPASGVAVAKVKVFDVAPLLTIAPAATADTVLGNVHVTV